MEALVLIVALAAVPVGIATWYWSGPARIRRALRTARRVSIAEAPEGEVVRIDGRVAEGEAIEIGEPIAVMCQPVREPDPDAASRTAGYRDLPPTRLRVGGSSAHPILLSDSQDVTRRPRRHR